MQAIEQLIERSRALEDLARSIQSEKAPGPGADDADQLVRDYHEWFGDCMAVLPQDLTERFRGEYEGGTVTMKIRSFLSGPLEVSILHRAGSEKPEMAMFPYWQHPFDTAFRAPLVAQRQMLIEANSRAPLQSLDTLDVIRRICTRLSYLAVPLASRRKGKDAFVVTDEYDVQDLLHGVLRLFFLDVRAEERMSSRGGASATSDFLLKDERVLVEAKITRPGRADKAIGDELIIDIERYRVHPDCDTLVALVYDAGRHIQNAAGLQADLSGKRDGLEVLVYVCQ